VNSLPKTVTRQHRNCDFNLCTFSKTGSVQVAAARHEVGKLLRVSVSLSEKPLHRDSGQQHSEGRWERSVHSSVGTRHISVRCRRPRHADRSRSYCVRHPRRRLGLALILRYRADPADRRWFREVSHVPLRIWHISRLGLRTDPFWYVRVTYRRCHLST